MLDKLSLVMALMRFIGGYGARGFHSNIGINFVESASKFKRA